jgi:polyribonucleotide 5'-hydroxyl-kinase
MALHRPIDVVEEFSAATNLYKTSPIVYYYGTTDIQEKKHVYSSMLTELAKSVVKKLDDKLVKHAGVIIDTPSQFAEPSGSEMLYQAIDDFEVNVILVIGHERLLSELQRKFAGSDITVLKLAKSGGVVARDKAARKEELFQRVREYFYGSPGADLNPFSQTVSFNDIIVRHATEGFAD